MNELSPGETLLDFLARSITGIEARLSACHDTAQQPTTDKGDDMSPRPTAPAARTAAPATRPTAPAAPASRPAAPAARQAAPPARQAAPAAPATRPVAQAARPAAPAAPAVTRPAAPASRPAAPAQRPAAPAAPVARQAAPVQRPVARQAAPVQEELEPLGFQDTEDAGFGDEGFGDVGDAGGFDAPGGFDEVGGFDAPGGFDDAESPEAFGGTVDGEGDLGFADDLQGFEGEQFPGEEQAEQVDQGEYVSPVAAGEYLLKASAPYATFLVGEDSLWYAGDEGVTTNKKVVKVVIEPDWLQPVVNKVGENWVVVNCDYLQGAVVVPVTSLLNLDKTPVEVVGPVGDEAPSFDEPGDFDPGASEAGDQGQASYTQEQLDAVNAAYAALDNIRTLFGMP